MIGVYLKRPAEPEINKETHKKETLHIATTRIMSELLIILRPIPEFCQKKCLLP